VSGVQRKRVRPQPRTVTRVTTLGALTGGGDGSPDLRAAAEIIASGAKTLAGTWDKTRQVVDSISVTVDGNVATITASAPPARPAELRLKHPLFGDRAHWYGPPGAPFLAPAADARADAAMARYAKKIDKWAAQAGYR
jgi:hypothetical protein